MPTETTPPTRLPAVGDRVQLTCNASVLPLTTTTVRRVRLDRGERGTVCRVVDGVVYVAFDAYVWDGYPSEMFGEMFAPVEASGDEGPMGGAW